METVLVVGASGNIGVSVVIAALQSGRQALAIVRNKDSQAKIIKHVGTDKGITFVEADVLSESGIRGVVERVRAGELPAFQHVYAAVGSLCWDSPTYEMPSDKFNHVMKASFGANFNAYRATMPYLVEQGNPNSTLTIITGSLGDLAIGGVTSISQAALMSLTNVAAFETAKTNVRFNEVCLHWRVEYDSVAAASAHKEQKPMGSSDFSKVYVDILANKEIRGSRVSVSGWDDLETSRYESKLGSNPFNTEEVRQMLMASSQ